MSLSVLEYVERVYQAASKGLPEEASGLFRISIEARLPNALSRLADEVSKSSSSERKGLLQKSYSLTLSGGEISLLSLASTLLVHSIPSSGYVTLSGVSQPLNYVPNRADLDNPLPFSDFTNYTIFANRIIVRTHLGTIPTQTALTIFGSYVPLLSELPAQLEDELVDLGISMSMQGLADGEVKEDVKE